MIPVSSTWPTACHSHCAGVGWIYCNCSGGACLPSVTTKSESCQLWGGLTELSVTEMTPVFQNALHQMQLGVAPARGFHIATMGCDLRVASKDSGNTTCEKTRILGQLACEWDALKSRTAKLLIECRPLSLLGFNGLVRKHSESRFSIIRHVTRPTENHQATSMKKNETEYWIHSEYYIIWICLIVSVHMHLHVHNVHI